jgi:Metallo-beta-lactamase superfamily
VADDAPTPTRIHFLDVGRREYGDCALLELSGRSVLIDGAHPGDQVASAGHPSIPEQLRTLLGVSADPVEVDLLVVTHAHQDHIGCLPFLVEHDLLSAKWALVADPGLGWGRAAGQPDVRPETEQAARLVAALREEPRTQASDDADLAQFLVDAASLESQYTAMLAKLVEAGANVVRYGRDDAKKLLAAFKSAGLAILGPSEDQLLACA